MQSYSDFFLGINQLMNKQSKREIKDTITLIISWKPVRIANNRHGNKNTSVFPMWNPSPRKGTAGKKTYIYLTLPLLNDLSGHFS